MVNVKVVFVNGKIDFLLADETLAALNVMQLADKVITCRTYRQVALSLKRRKQWHKQLSETADFAAKRNGW
jgi:hypothetical protein